MGFNSGFKGLIDRQGAYCLQVVRFSQRYCLQVVRFSQRYCLQVVRFSQRYCWKFEYSEMWRCVLA